MYDVGSKVQNGIKRMYVNNMEVRVSRLGLVDSSIKQGYFMSPWLFNVYMDGVMKEVKIRIGRVVL